MDIVNKKILLVNFGDNCSNGIKQSLQNVNQDQYTINVIKDLDLANRFIIDNKKNIDITIISIHKGQEQEIARYVANLFVATKSVYFILMFDNEAQTNVAISYLKQKSIKFSYMQYSVYDYDYKNIAQGLIAEIKTVNLALNDKIVKKKSSIFNVKLDAIAIASSTGGINELDKFVTYIDDHIDAIQISPPIFITQHTSSDSTAVIVKNMQKNVKLLSVFEAAEDMICKNNCVYVAPGSSHIKILKKNDTVYITLDNGPPVNFCIPSADIMFESLVKVYGSNITACVLTGMGQDGAAGSKMISDAGGIVFAQNQETSVVWGMPKATIDLGICDYILSTYDIAKKIIEMICINKHKTVPKNINQEVSQDNKINIEHNSQYDFLNDISDSDFDVISGILRKDTGISISVNKKYLFRTRLLNLVKKYGITSIQNLVYSLTAKSDISEQIKCDFIESMVTNETLFFRDDILFQTLKNTTLPELIKKRMAKKQLNIWSAACSSGQEIYSIAILLKQFPILHDWTIYLLATDISEKMLNRAKDGSFSQFEIDRGANDKEVNKFFIKTDAIYKIKDEIKSMISFAQHNILQNANFGVFDIILCRNVLIYFDLQDKKQCLGCMMGNLAQDGYFIPGGSEKIGSFDKRYELLDNKANIYKKNF